MKYFIGIDNGLDGGIVVLGENGEIHMKCVMPVIKLGKGRAVNVHNIDAILGGLSIQTMALLENASKHSPGVLALCSTWYSLGCVETVLKISGTRYDLINPQKWQKEFWTRPKMPKGTKFDTKAAALNAANKLWPGTDWTKSERASKPHDGIVDAALLAEFARRNQL
tara:strand:- start:794 stop:1294 length:501 start_codon:yes stop_codon:yes gene_type:complete